MKSKFNVLRLQKSTKGGWNKKLGGWEKTFIWYLSFNELLYAKPIYVCDMCVAQYLF